MSRKYRGQSDTGTTQGFSIMIGLVEMFIGFLGSISFLPARNSIFLVLPRPTESLTAMNRMMGVVMLIVVILNSISLWLTFKKTQGKELIFGSMVASIFAALAHIIYTLIVIVYFNSSFAFNNLRTYEFLGAGLFFLLVAVFRIRQFIPIKIKGKRSYMIAPVIAIPLLIAAILYPFYWLFQDEGYGNYQKDRFSANTECENTQFNSMNKAVVIDDTVYCVIRGKTLDEPDELIKVTSDGNVEVMDSSDTIMCEILVSHGNDIYYRKKITEDEFAFCILNVATGNINMHTADELAPEYEYVFNSYSELFGVRDDKLIFNVGSGIYSVELNDGDIDVSTLASYVPRAELSFGDRRMTFYNMFVHEYGYFEYYGPLLVGDLQIVDGRLLNKGSYGWGYQGTYPIFSLDRDADASHDPCINQISSVCSYTAYNGSVYYVQYENGSYGIYSAGLDLSSPVLLCEYDAPDDKGDINTNNINLIASDSYLVFIDGDQVETIPL